MMNVPLFKALAVVNIELSGISPTILTKKIAAAFAIKTRDK